VGINRLLTELPRYDAAARELQTQATVWFSSHGMVQAATSVNATQPGRLLVEWCLSLVQDIPQLAGTSLFVFILTLFMLIERNAFRKKLSKRASEFARSNARVMRDVQHYLGIKTLVSVITGVLATIWCFAWGVQNALLWGVLAFVLNYIPVAGSIAAAIPPVAIALLTGDASQWVAISLGYIAINTVVGGILEPRWLGRACGLSPLVALMSIVIWGALLGPVGALLSVPLTSALRLGLARFRDFSWLSQLMTEERPSLEVPLGRPEPASSPAPDSSPAASVQSS
jgi:predicted PurR-regulated permease PerM